MKTIDDILKDAPDGIFICEAGVYKVEDGNVVELSAPTDGVSTKRIGTIHEPPGQNDDS